MKYYIVNAFAEELFKGNQAGVCVLDEFLDDDLMQLIAAENNLAETAFVVKRGDHYDLRWFTPEIEIDLCGHATLATAFVIVNFVEPQVEEMQFHTMSGILTVKRNGDLYDMDFPSRMPVPIACTPLMEQALGVPITAAFASRDIVLVVENEKQVADLKPNMELLSQIPDCFGLIVTAKGNDVDFVSRYFAPNAGIPEDPVTGSAHATLIPFWAQKLGKQDMVAKQLSKRGGMLLCKDCGDRVIVSGKATLYLQGELRVN